jgi:hypothetical protein
MRLLGDLDTLFLLSSLGPELGLELGKLKLILSLVTGSGLNKGIGLIMTGKRQGG